MTTAIILGGIAFLILNVLTLAIVRGGALRQRRQEQDREDQQP
jgi:hypothetical protein